MILHIKTGHQKKKPTILYANILTADIPEHYKCCSTTAVLLNKGFLFELYKIIR